MPLIARALFPHRFFATYKTQKYSFRIFTENKIIFFFKWKLAFLFLFSLIVFVWSCELFLCGATGEWEWNGRTWGLIRDIGQELSSWIASFILPSPKRFSVSFSRKKLLGKYFKASRHSHIYDRPRTNVKIFYRIFSPRRIFINKFDERWMQKSDVFIAAIIPKINIICVYLFVQFTTFTLVEVINSVVCFPILMISQGFWCTIKYENVKLWSSFYQKKSLGNIFVFRRQLNFSQKLS